MINDIRMPLWGFKARKFPIACAHSQHAVLTQHTHLGAQVPASIFFLPFWKRMFPNFIFVHAVRDARDGPYGQQGDLFKHMFDVLPNDEETTHFSPDMREATLSRIEEFDKKVLQWRKKIGKPAAPPNNNNHNILIKPDMRALGGKITGRDMDELYSTEARFTRPFLFGFSRCFDSRTSNDATGSWAGMFRDGM